MSGEGRTSDHIFCHPSVHDDIVAKTEERIIASLRSKGDDAWPKEEHFRTAKYRAVETRLKMQAANFHGAATAIERGDHRA